MRHPTSRVPSHVAALAAFALLPGCLAYKAVTTPVKLAAGAVIVTGETAGAAVSTTGRVAVSAINAVGRVGGGSIDAASRLAETGMVTFVDVSTGTIVRVPWREGATLASAGADARLKLALKTVDVVRAGHVIFSAPKLAGEGTRVASGDVVRVRG